MSISSLSHIGDLTQVDDDSSSLLPTQLNLKLNFYRAMHYSAKRGLAIACRLSLSVRPYVRTIRYDTIR